MARASEGNCQRLSKKDASESTIDRRRATTREDGGRQHSNSTNKQWEQQRQSGLIMRAVLDDWQAKATQFLSFGSICLTNFLMSLLHLPKNAVVTVSSSLFLTVPELLEL